MHIFLYLFSVLLSTSLLCLSVSQPASQSWVSISLIHIPLNLSVSRPISISIPPQIQPSLISSLADPSFVPARCIQSDASPSFRSWPRAPFTQTKLSTHSPSITLKETVIEKGSIYLFYLVVSVSLHPRTPYYPHPFCSVVVYFINITPSNIYMKKSEKDHSIGTASRKTRWSKEAT